MRAVVRAPQLPDDAIPIPSWLIQDGAQFGLLRPQSACIVFGHRALTMYADAAAAKRRNWPLDLPVGKWCPGCGAWL